MQPSDFVQIATFKDRPVMYRFPKPNHIELRLPFDRSLIQRAKDMGLNWREKDKVWHGEANAMFAKQMVRLLPESKETFLSRRLLHMPSTNGWEPSAYLMEHQKRGAEIARDHDRFCFWWQTGTGKTCHSIEIIRQKGIKTLVVCPLSIIETAWLEDISRFAPEIKAVNLWRARKARNGRTGSAAWDTLINGCQVGIINFDSFKIIKDELAACGFRMLIVDESSFVKNPKAQITKELTKFADRLPYVYLMSGTPAPNSEEEFFSQVRMVDPFLFGRNFYLFKSQWFEPTDWTGFKFRMKPDLREEFKRRVAKVSDFVEKHKVLDLPDRTFNIRKVFLSDTERKIYNQMARKMVAEIEEQEIAAANAAVKVMKLREVTSGFLIDEEGKVAQFGKSKLNELMALLQEIGNRQVLIWIQFQHEARTISDMLGQDARVCNSTVTQARKIENVVDFKTGRYRYLIAHPGTLGHGNTMINCADVIYYSLSHSFEKHSQSMDRNYRKGQEKQCSYYFLLADNSIDEPIYRVLHMKESRMRDVLDYNPDIEINKEVLEHVRQFK